MHWIIQGGGAVNLKLARDFGVREVKLHEVGAVLADEGKLARHRALHRGQPQPLQRRTGHRQVARIATQSLEEVKLTKRILEQIGWLGKERGREGAGREGGRERFL